MTRETIICQQRKGPSAAFVHKHRMFASYIGMQVNMNGFYDMYGNWLIQETSLAIDKILNSNVSTLWARYVITYSL
jgi:hypothetical protein